MGEIAAASQMVADDAGQQAGLLEGTSSCLELMGAITNESAGNSQQAMTWHAPPRNAATEGAAAMDQTTGAIVKIKVAAEGTSQIIKDIDEITFQTNLLALNAAVESVRAGERPAGASRSLRRRRSLALRSKQAAHRIEELIRQSVEEAGEDESTARNVSEKLSDSSLAIVERTNSVIARQDSRTVPWSVHVSACAPRPLSGGCSDLTSLRGSSG